MRLVSVENTDRRPLERRVPLSGVSAVTVIFHTGPVLWFALEALLAQPELAELILVLNGADPETRERLSRCAEADRRIRVLDPGSNLGYAAGCNLGAEQANGAYLALVNPDCNFAPGTFGAVLDVFAQHPGAWLVGGRVQHPDGREQRGARREFLTPWRAFVEATGLSRLFPRHPYFRRFHILEETPRREASAVPVVSGAFMMMRRALYEQLGGMDEAFFFHFDDLDLCLRIHQEGGQVLYAPHVPITHYRSTSDVPKLFVEWHKTRGGCRYFSKHFRASYPAWTLVLLSGLLWARFALAALKCLPYDFGLVRSSRSTALGRMGRLAGS